MAQDFDTSTGKLTWGNQTFMNGATIVVWSMHIIPVIDGTRRGLWTRWNPNNNNAQFMIEAFSSGDLRAFISNSASSDQGDNYVQTGNSPLTASVYNHLLIVYDGGEGDVIDRVRFYINNVESTASKSEVGTVPTAMVSVTTEDLIFNLDNHNNGTPTLALWGGIAAELAMWTGIVPTSDERAALSDGCPASHIRHGSLQLDSPLDGGFSPEPDYALEQTSVITGAVYADHPSMAPRIWGMGWEQIVAAAVAAEGGEHESIILDSFPRRLQHDATGWLSF